MPRIFLRLQQTYCFSWICGTKSNNNRFPHQQKYVLKRMAITFSLSYKYVISECSKEPGFVNIKDNIKGNVPFYYFAKYVNVTFECSLNPL